jgi:3-hexulose-6-phosphate synthase
MKLQLALDEIAVEDALRLGDKVRGSVDIFEIGTPFIIAEGMAPVRAFKARFPEAEVLADVKIMDAGETEARLAFEAGADYVTALGVTDLATVAACLKAAADYGGTVVVDMMCVDDMKRRIEQLEGIGVRALAVHTGVDQQAAGRTPLDDLRLMKAHARASRIFVAGGIVLDTAPRYIEVGADVVVVGGAILRSPDPAQEARGFRALLDRGSGGR